MGDVAGIAALAERYWEFEGIGGFDRPRIESILGNLICGARNSARAGWRRPDGRLCGYLVAVFMLSLEHGGLMAEIDEVFVSQDMRSTGLGSLLVTTAERELAERGLRRLQLQLGADNERARPLL